MTTHKGKTISFLLCFSEMDRVDLPKLDIYIRRKYKDNASGAVHLRKEPQPDFSYYDLVASYENPDL